MSLDAIKTALYNWLQRETGLTCIEADQGKPRPQIPYLEFKFIGAAQRVGGIDELRAPDQDATGEEDTFRQTGLRQASLSLNIFGKGANDRMAQLRDTLDRPDVVEEFSAAGIAHLGEEGPQDLTALEDTVHRERSQMDLILGFSIDNAVTVEVIEEVEVEAENFPGGDTTFKVVREE